VTEQQFDIVIIGGGLNGAALLHALKSSGLRVLMLDSQNFFQHPPSNDSRTLTLSIASQRILQHLQLWSELARHTTMIQKIHVSEQGRFGTACLEHPDHQPLGYVIPIQNLVTGLYQNLDHQQVWAPATVIGYDPEQRRLTIQKNDQICTVRTSIVVAADGSHSTMRTLCNLTVNIKEYGQEALVTYLDLARTQSNIAYERFTQKGPLALLPLAPKRMGVVWSLPPQEAQQMMQMEDAVFMQAIMQGFGYRLGRFVNVGPRMRYPLRQMLMPKSVQGAVVFIGNASHTLHPVAGQGFNLGLRDVAMLAQMVRHQTLHDLTVLTQYQKARDHDQTAIAQLTDGLVSLYANSSLGLRVARQWGLLLLDNNRWLKNNLARYASGLAGVVPDLVCGISL
jgi:2-octaprenyl-6-methoxyphenol hydroxylase